MLTAEQLAERKTGIGGSDMAAVLGLSPWKTGAELWGEKVGQVEPEDLSDNELIHFGNVLEDVVANEYVRRRSQREGREVKVRRVNRMLRHRKHPFLIAHLDRDVLNEPRILECKTADKWSAGKWGAVGTDEVPEHYLIQGMHYLLVADAEECDLAVLIGGNEYREYRIRRDEVLCTHMIDAGREFWRYVETKEPYPVNADAPRAIEALKKLYPGTNGQTIKADTIDEHWRAVCQDATKLCGEYEKTADRGKAHLLRRMRDNAVMEFADGGRLTRKEVKRKAFTVDATTFVDARFAKPKGDADGAES